jgi:hypothetical protein
METPFNWDYENKLISTTNPCKRGYQNCEHVLDTNRVPRTKQRIIRSSQGHTGLPALTEEHAQNHRCSLFAINRTLNIPAKTDLKLVAQTRSIVNEGDCVRVLITTDFYLPTLGGVTTVVLNERSTLTKLGHEVRLLTIGPNRTSFYEDGVYHLHASPLKLFPDSYMTFSYRDPLLADILEWSPEVVHSNNEFFTMGYARRIAHALGVRLVHTCHTDFTRYNEQMRIRHHLWDQLMGLVVKRRVRFSNLIISPSVAHHSMLCRYGITKEMVVLPSGIELERFSFTRLCIRLKGSCFLGLGQF